MNQTNLSGALFSNVQQRLLGLLFGRPERSFYTSEIVKVIGSGTGAVDRELNRLHASGIISQERIGNQKHYRANQKSPIYSELYSLIRKTVGLKEPITQALVPFEKNIRAAFIYGSVAKKTDTASSDVDLMIVGENFTYSDIFSRLEEVEDIIGRPINPTILEPKEWRERLDKKNSFTEKIMEQPKIFIFGSEADL